MQSPAPASVAPASPWQGTSTVQLHGWPPHDVVLASCGPHTFGSTVDGVVVKLPGHPRPVPDELPEEPLLDPLDPPEPEPPELLDPPELEDPPPPLPEV